MLSVLSISVASAAGSPLHEDFSKLLEISDKMLEAAKAKDETAFSTAAGEASDAAKDQGMHGNSPRLQRVSTAFKKAKKAAKTGNFDEATTIINDAVAEMKKPDTKPTFGGTTEGGGRKGVFGEY